MRGSQVLGRFNIDYEAASMYDGITDDLSNPVGQTVDWWVWSDATLANLYNLEVDPIYDVSNSTPGKGRQWALPFQLPVVSAQMTRAASAVNERGFYTSDTLRLVINSGVAHASFPDLLLHPTAHIKDRVVYLSEVFTPIRVTPHGAFGKRWATIAVDFDQVNSEQLNNDPQFLQLYADYTSADPRLIAGGYGSSGYGTDPYGA